MFFGSATNSPSYRHRSKAAFARDLAASIAAIGALGALLAMVQDRPGVQERFGVQDRFGAAAPRALKVAPAVQFGDPPPRRIAARPARQPSDEASTPDADEERIARAMVAFALSKVSPLQPEPLASIPHVMAPLPVRAPQLRKPVKTQPASRLTASRIPVSPGQAGFGQAGFGQAGFGQAGFGQAGFTQAEWPIRIGESRFSATPKDQPALIAMTRFVPQPRMLISGAQSFAGGARKTVNDGVTGIRSGVSAVRDKARAVAGRLW